MESVERTCFFQFSEDVFFSSVGRRVFFQIGERGNVLFPAFFSKFVLAE